MVKNLKSVYLYLIDTHAYFFHLVLMMYLQSGVQSASWTWLGFFLQYTMILLLKESAIIWLHIECTSLDIHGCIDFDIDDKIMHFLLEF